MPKEKFDVTVLVMGKGGSLLKELPHHVKVQCLYGNENSTVERIWNCVKIGRVAKGFKIGWYTIQAKRARTVFEQEMYHSKILPNFKTEYDLAIAFHGPVSFPVVYVINHLQAKTKIAWIHNDVSYYRKELERYKEFYKEYDNIFCVSKYALNKFVEVCPGLKEKTSVFYNIISQKKLELMSVKDESYNDDFDGIRILTVGRLAFEKGQDIIPDIIIKLKLEGYKIRWYCIGDGPNLTLLESKIKKYGLEKELILLGNQKNPYPYLRECDIYVQPSRHEAYCIALAEARGFNKPIITTDSVGAKEQIIDGETGYVVKMDENEIYRKVIKLINNKMVRDTFSNNLKRSSVDNLGEIKKLEKLLNM